MRSSYIPLLCAMLLIGGMVGAAEVFRNNEIIFPEIAAIAAGALLKSELAWRTDSRRIFCSIAVCAALGLGIVLFMPGAVWFQMSAAYLAASVLFMISGTSFAPMISAAVLPVLLQTRSVVYLLAACILTALILLVRQLLIRKDILADKPFRKLPFPDRNDIIQMMIRWLIVTAVIFSALGTGLRFAAAPPLLVAFTEFWKPGAVSRKQPLSVIALIALCAVSGAGIRLLLCVSIGIPMCIAAALTIAVVYFIMKRIGLMLPPAAAISVLAFLIPEKMLLVFPVHILIGISVLVGASFLYREKAAQAVFRKGRRILNAVRR